MFEGKSDEFAKFLENSGQHIDFQGNPDLWQWNISNDNKLIVNKIFRSNESWLGHIQGSYQTNGDQIFKMSGFRRFHVFVTVSDHMKEMAKEMTFPFELYDHFTMDVLVNLNKIYRDYLKLDMLVN